MKRAGSRVRGHGAAEQSPLSSGFRMPEEWAPHRATWIAFPHHRTDFPGKLHAVAWTFAEMARVLSAKEEVQVLVRDPAEAARARATFEAAGVNLERTGFVRADTNRSWTRDSMPLWLTRARGRSSPKIAVNFRFDGWSRYRDHKKDDAAGVKVAERSLSLGQCGSVYVPKLPDGTRAVLEGGSIDVDEYGTLLTTRECLLTSARARFGAVGQELCEQILCESLGVSKILWLDSGIVGDDTSGHIDDFARFAPGGKVLVSSEVSRRDANYAPLLKARKTLENSTNARGRRLTVLPLPMPSPAHYRGERLPASYANFYVGNAAVLVPVFNDANDREALDIIASAFPDRPTVGIYARDLVVGLGTLHCSTMQEPA
jgi:agmatine deiminase